MKDSLKVTLKVKKKMPRLHFLWSFWGSTKCVIVKLKRGFSGYTMFSERLCYWVLNTHIFIFSTYILLISLASLYHLFFCPLRLVVTATDRGSPRLAGSATLTVIIVDQNDNSPTIPLPQEVRIPESEHFDFCF